MDRPETMYIKSENPDSQGPCILINKDDFDPDKHEEYKGKVPVGDAKEAPTTGIPANVPPPPPAPVKSEAPKEDDDDGEVKFTANSVKELADEAGLELEPGKGSGKGGKYTKADVEAAIEGGDDE